MPLREGDPESIGGYRIESRIGAGGMGVVYLARSASGRAVAVKVVHTQYADDPEFRARFRQEVKAARRVSGAFTAPVVDADPEAALPWMATAYVPGDTLAQRIADQGPLDWPQLKRLGGELAEALREIHRAEVVHRDLKPSNVLLLESTDGADSGGGSGTGGDGGMTRVIDFGISRAAQSDVRTQTGLVMGSPPFMAPEQFSSPRDVGPPVDVFALGALLVYAATGRSPFEAENAYLAAYQTVHNDPELGALPEALHPLVMSCLAKSPQDRPTPAQVLDALAALPDEGPRGEPRERTPEEHAEHAERAEHAEEGATAVAAPRPRRGRRFKVALVSAVALVAMIGTGVSAAFLDGTDSGGRGTEARAGVPEGWKPWHVGAQKDEEDMMPSSEACTPHARGVYCASPTTALTRLDPLTGKVSWTKPMHRPKAVTGYSVTDPVVGADAVFTYSAEGSGGVDAYDAQSGRRLWRLPGPHAEFQYLSGVLVVHKGELNASHTSTYTAYEPRSGRELWHHEVTSDSAGAFYAGPDGTLFADLRAAARKGGAASSEIARYDARTGRKLGGTKAPKGDLWLATVHAGKGYFARWEDDDSGVSSRFFIQDLTSGKVRGIDFPWAVRPEAPPLVRGDAMYLFDYANETVLALDLKRGKPLWTTSRELRIFSEPSVRGDNLYATMPDSSVIAINIRTGRERWRSEQPSFEDSKNAGGSKDDQGGSVDDRSPNGVAPLSLGGVLYGVTDEGTFSVAAKG
ncbi:PQQ-binding-like beta-propeller repeat protein [Streptomyces sp. NPDC057302]|uniref:serine/threonine-protein kinase n=1 Tax=Streptomyces sp. NPDC057302 TaxID=3346094 RepID=UPI003634EC98